MNQCEPSLKQNKICPAQFFFEFFEVCTNKLFHGENVSPCKQSRKQGLEKRKEKNYFLL